MRNIATTNSTSDVTDEYADAVQDLIAAAGPDRETTQKNRNGELTFYIRLYGYQAPELVDGTQQVAEDGGEYRWAVDYFDSASRELEEFDTEEEATGHYLDQVRVAAGNLGVDENHEQIRFTTTDVEGVPGPLANA